MLEMPQPLPAVECQCPEWRDEDGGCACGLTERVLRAGGPFNAEQREWCLQEIARVEGHRREDHETDTDKELGRSVLSAWVDYCRDKGLM
jgi:hypothetical protein